MRHRVTVVNRKHRTLGSRCVGILRLESRNGLHQNCQPDSGLVTAYHGNRTRSGRSWRLGCDRTGSENLTLDYLVQVSELQEKLRGIVIQDHHRCS